MKQLKTLLLLLFLFGIACPVNAQTAAPPKSKTQEKEGSKKAKPKQEKEKDSKKKSDESDDDEKDSDKKNDDEDQESDDKDMKDDDKQKAEDKEQEDDDKKKGKDEIDEDKNDDDDEEEDGPKEMNEDLKTDIGTALNSVQARISRNKEISKASSTLAKVFEPVVSSVNDSTIKIMSGKRQIALGVVVDSDGLILTKASELRGVLGCKLPNGEIATASVFGVDKESDLALLKIEASDLSVGQWSDESAPVIGRWLATPKAVVKSDAPVIGVVSVDNRPIPPSKPFIGINMRDAPLRVLVTDNGGEALDTDLAKMARKYRFNEIEIMEKLQDPANKKTVTVNDDVVIKIHPEGDKGGVIIMSIVPRSPASFAGLKSGDRIFKIDDVEIKDVTALRETLQQYDVDDRIALAITRSKEDIKINLTLAERDKVSPDNRRSNTQNNMGSILSRRRKNFPTAFQHDSGLTSNNCGGPIVDLSGKIVGINIARAGRVSSLALPTKLVQPIIEMLKTGEYAPAVVNKEEIAKIDTELGELFLKSEGLPGKKANLQLRYGLEKARAEEIERSIKDLQNRLKVVKEKATKQKKDLDEVRLEIRSIDKIRQKLEADRQELSTGSR
jgi:serine protease Do